MKNNTLMDIVQLALIKYASIFTNDSCLSNFFLVLQMIYIFLYEEKEMESNSKRTGVEIMQGHWANCPQNLVRAHKMLRPRAQMILENVDLFQ